MDHYDPAEHEPVYIDCDAPVPDRTPRHRRQKENRGKYHDLSTAVKEALMGFSGSLKDLRIMEDGHE